MLKDCYHLKPGWVRKFLFSFFGSYYFYLHEYSLCCLQFFQFNRTTKMENSIPKSYQRPGIICSICLAISDFSVQNKNRHPDPSLTRLLSMSLNPKAVCNFLATQEHRLHIILDSRQMRGPVWNFMPVSCLSMSLLVLLSLADQCLPIKPFHIPNNLISKTSVSMPKQQIAVSAYFCYF